MENVQNTEEQATYAGFGKRMAALFIDRVIISIAITFAYWEVNREVLRMIKQKGSILNKMYKISDDSLDMSKYDVADNITYYAMSVIFTLVLWCYYAGMESSPWKGTIGKKMIGLEVSDLTGNRISFTKATGRYFGKIISIVVLCIGYIAMLFNDKKQTWHDSMSGCIVTEK